MSGAAAPSASGPLSCRASSVKLPADLSADGSADEVAVDLRDEPVAVDVFIACSRCPKGVVDGILVRVRGDFSVTVGITQQTIEVELGEHSVSLEVETQFIVAVADNCLIVLSQGGRGPGFRPALW